MRTSNDCQYMGHTRVHGRLTYSPQIGQSHSVECSLGVVSISCVCIRKGIAYMHLCESCKAMDIQTLQRLQSGCISQRTLISLLPPHTEKILAKTMAYTTDTTVGTVVNMLVLVVVP